MILKQLYEIAWVLYQNGKTNANDQKVRKPDMEQKCKLAFASAIRQLYYESMATDEYRRPDYSFTSPLLEVKRFELTDEVKNGSRRCDMSSTTMYRLPKNAHITNVYPVGECKNDELGEITQVAPGEENFYINDSELSELMFFVIKGKGINTYNIPFCVKQLDVEATYDIGPDTEIDNAVAGMVLDQVLGVTLGIKKQYYSEDARKQIEEQNVVQ